MRFRCDAPESSIELKTVLRRLVRVSMSALNWASSASLAFILLGDGEEDGECCWDEEDANDAVPEQIPMSRKVVKAASSPKSNSWPLWALRRLKLNRLSSRRVEILLRSNTLSTGASSKEGS